MFASQPQGRRAAKRTACKIRATAHCRGRSSPAALLDLSPHGLRIYLRSDIDCGPGSQVTVETEELGPLSGEVRWMRFPYMGISLAQSSNTAAKIASYFKARR